MYLRPVFTETDPERIRGLIAANPFGVLVTTGPEGMAASHIPFGLVVRGDAFVLTGHLAAANAQCAALDGGSALAVFSGPHAYIAPGWYRTGPAVPTWDYAAVHVSGRLVAVSDPAAMTRDLQGLAAADPLGFDMAAMPADYRAKMMAGIRAFEMVPTRIEAQWKMSQNRSAADRAGVVAGLRAMGGEGPLAVADLIAAGLPGG